MLALAELVLRLPPPVRVAQPIGSPRSVRASVVLALAELLLRLPPPVRVAQPTGPSVRPRLGKAKRYPKVTLELGTSGNVFGAGH